MTDSSSLTALVPVEPTVEMVEAICATSTFAKWPDDFGDSARALRRELARKAWGNALGTVHSHSTSSRLTDEQILEALTIPGLNVEVSLEPRELPILLDGIRSIIDHVSGRLSVLEIAMDGVSQEMLDGGWNARSLSKYARSLEEKIAAGTPMEPI